MRAIGETEEDGVNASSISEIPSDGAIPKDEANERDAACAETNSEDGSNDSSSDSEDGNGPDDESSGGSNYDDTEYDDGKNDPASNGGAALATAIQNSNTSTDKESSEGSSSSTHQPLDTKEVDKETSNERMDRIEKVLESMASAMKSLQTGDKQTSSRPETDQNWIEPVCTSSTMERNASVIRWDNIQPFPPGIPANKMWEEWNRYIENFEIAASLSNATDPVKRTQLLFLSMGPDLQEIVRAAKLRPSLTDVNCYKTFVANIHEYFRTMTDTAAEHEAFSSMHQEKNESAVAFHARLMCKVRLCGYSNDDQDRFVRAQLLKGLRNKELVKASRTYGYQTNFIVQAATRDEAYAAETSQHSDDHVFEIRRQQTFSSKPNRKRSTFGESSMEHHAKRRQIDYASGRRSRCSRCNLLTHRNGRCPALDKNCINCGKLGHFAAACRNKRVNEVRFKREDSSSDYGREDDRQVREN